MRPRRGTAIKPDASAELVIPRSAPPRSRQGVRPADAGRFSPLNAPQRALIEAFLAEAQPWAMKQARRSYRHLPAELHEQGFDQAAVSMRTGAPTAMDRRSLYADLARHLDDELRRIHVGWCLNQSEAVPMHAPPAETGPSVQQPVAAFIEDSLGGLERAVLQLELGAGRDTSTVRAALRLGPRQYARHRELGLGKLRGAISGGLRGRVCDQHLEAVTLASTGDRGAADRLSSGPERCRACAREASGLRRVLQQRLALAPWPLAIKPAGAIAAKVGALGAVFGGKGAAGGGFAGAGFAGTASGAKVVAGVVAAAAVASGGLAATNSADPKPAAAPAAAAAKAVSAPASKPQPVNRATAADPAAGGTAARKATRKVAAKKRRAARKQAATVAPAATAQAQTQAQAQHPTSPEPAAQAKPTEPVRKAVDQVKKTVDGVTGKLPVAVPKVDEVAPTVDKTVDGVTGAVGDVLAP